MRSSLFSRRLFGAGLLLLCLQAVAAVTDGPYVMRDAAGRLEAWTVETTPGGLRKNAVPVAPGAKLSIAAVGAIPAFNVTLRSPAEVAPDTVTTRSKAPLFVVADTHGEFEILAAMLMKHRIVNPQLRWSFGRGQLLILGDVFDRGPNQTEILWLLYELEAQARKAGGAVHFVLGNHETMVMRGDLRYLNPKYRQTTEILGVSSYAELFGANTVLGQWLRAKATVIKVNDLLCMHGGISRALVDHGFTLPQINTTLRAVMNERPFANDAERGVAEFLSGEQGPLWYRGYFEREGRPAEASADDIGRIRKQFGVRRILVGHTTVPTITPLYGGDVIAVQVYPKRDDAGIVHFEALLIRGGEFLRARPDGSTEKLLP